MLNPKPIFKVILLLFLMFLPKVHGHCQEYLRVDGGNFLKTSLLIKREGYSSIELKSNKGAFIDFSNSIENDFDGRIIWNYNNSGRFDFYGKSNFRNQLSFQKGMVGDYVTLSNEIQIPSSFSPGDPSIGLSDNTGNGINVHSAYGIGFATGGTHKVVITPSGQVGIGTNSPEYNLHVNGNLYSESLLGNTMSINHPNNISDWDSIWKCGFFDAFDTSNAPEENRWFWGINLGHRSNRDDYKYGGQIVIRNSPTTPRLYFRSRGRDGEGLWTQVLHSKGNQNIKGNLKVDGTISTEEIKVALLSASNMQLKGTLAADNITLNTSGHTADFVFEDSYSLRDLNQVEEFIKQHKHLPDIPSAAEMEASGVNLAEMNKLLLQKIEELTLYVIEKEKKIQEIISQKKTEEKKRERLELQMVDVMSLLKETSKRLDKIENSKMQ